MKSLLLGLMIISINKINMPLYLPKECLRKRDDCEPLAQVESDSKDTFVCCGLNKEWSRAVSIDRFRLCWKNSFVDEMGDYSDTDIKDTLSVLAQALSVDQHMKEESEKPLEKSSETKEGGWGE